MQNKQITLNCMEIGEKAIIERIELQNNIKHRLIDLGLITGTKIECMIKSPLGDPTAYMIKGTIIALRNEEASKIFIKSVDKK